MTPENDNLTIDEQIAALEAYEGSIEGMFACSMQRLKEELFALRRMAPKLARLQLDNDTLGRHGVNVELDRMLALFTCVIAAIEQESCPLSQSRRMRLDSLLPRTGQ